MGIFYEVVSNIVEQGGAALEQGSNDVEQGRPGYALLFDVALALALALLCFARAYFLYVSQTLPQCDAMCDRLRVGH